MVKSGFVSFVFVVTVLGALAAQDQRSAGKSNQVVLKYLGTAGWEITDGTTVILIDPYLSRINGPAPPGGGAGHSLAGDTRRAYGWGDVASPDVAAIDSHIQRADFVLVTHTHYDGERSFFHSVSGCSSHPIRQPQAPPRRPRFPLTHYGTVRSAAEPCGLSSASPPRNSSSDLRLLSAGAPHESTSPASNLARASARTLVLCLPFLRMQYGCALQTL